MTNSAIKDWQIAASSSKQRSDDHQCAVKYARLESNIFTFLGVVSVTLIALRVFQFCEGLSIEFLYFAVEVTCEVSFLSCGTKK